MTRIVGGSEVTPVSIACCDQVCHVVRQANKYPWVVALTTLGGGQYCGGTLVASKYVITAAHCMWQDQEMTIPTPADQIKV